MNSQSMNGPSTNSEQAAQAVDQAIAGRRSVRRFKSDPVAGEVLRAILDVARHAPSGTNMQPWHVAVVAGEPKRALSAAIHKVFNSGKVPPMEYEYYPAPFFEPYLARRRKVGWALYGALGIVKGDSAKMHAQAGRNYDFFDAPVGMIFSIDRGLKIGSWLDYGTFLQNIAIAARGRGLDTCMQAAFCFYHDTIREHLGVPQSHIVVCGMSLGYAVADAPENIFPIERASVDGFTTFIGI